MERASAHLSALSEYYDGHTHDDSFYDMCAHPTMMAGSRHFTGVLNIILASLLDDLSQYIYCIQHGFFYFLGAVQKSNNGNDVST